MDAMRVFPLLLVGALTALLAPSSSAQADAKGWAKEVPITTSWEDAIAECKATGKLLFIYNGWQREGT
jgi:hypothetical protein